MRIIQLNMDTTIKLCAERQKSNKLNFAPPRRTRAAASVFIVAG